MKTFTLLAALLFAPVASAQTAPSTPSPSPSAPSNTGTASKSNTGTTTSTTSTTSSTNTNANASASTSTSTSAKPAKLSKTELQVMAHYKAVNDMEIDLGKAAMKRGQSQGVKDYGKMLVTEHGDSNKKLMAFAKKRGQKIPMAKPMNDVEKQEKAEAKSAAMKLKKLKGAEFDTAFLAQMVVDHERELAKADAKVAEVQDAELADMIRAKKPVLQHHADHARELQKSGGMVSSGTMGTGNGAMTGSATGTATGTGTTGAARTSGTQTRTTGAGGTQGTATGTSGSMGTTGTSGSMGTTGTSGSMGTTGTTGTSGSMGTSSRTGAAGTGTGTQTGTGTSGSTSGSASGSTSGTSGTSGSTTPRR